MTDQSHLDSRYFIDPAIYNCPFCRRRHVTYRITSVKAFDWTDAKQCAAIVVQCQSCSRQSLHLSFLNICYSPHSGMYAFKNDIDIDQGIFYSVPTSFHTLDANIPAIIRELFAEADGCQKSNYLTGASACARKLVYELAVNQGAKGDNYEDRIKSLKGLLPNVDGAYFDTLLTIQEITSEKVHENSYDGWSGAHLRLILATLAEVLHEVYVLPNVRKEKRKAILALKDEVVSAKKVSVDEGKA